MTGMTAMPKMEIKGRKSQLEEVLQWNRVKAEGLAWDPFDISSAYHSSSLHIRFYLCLFYLSGSFPLVLEICIDPKDSLDRLLAGPLRPIVPISTLAREDSLESRLAPVFLVTASNEFDGPQ
jgi:hypothetical protein